MRWFMLSPFLVAAMSAAGADTAPAPAPREDIVRRAAESGESVWNRIEQGDKRLSSRTYYSYALALLEANAHLERIPRILEAAAAMQDRNPDSPSYGNFYWYGDEERIQDFNAVEFCMRSAVLIWMRHADTLPEESHRTLRETLEYAIEGCRLHAVPVSYTNIALMRSLNLILLGESLDKPDVAEAGYDFLNRVVLYTWQFGIHEYCSPTYYGTDLECLYILHAFTRSESARAQAQALLELIWTDIAANWYSEADRIGGACSRTYDYVHGQGELDALMAGAGWLPPETCSNIYVGVTNWQPPARLWELSTTRYPRLVQQRWGKAQQEYRTAYLCRDVTLSASGAQYSNMDQTLVVDFPGDRNMPHCYFIPDGRGDPYGTKRIPAGAHQKAQHLGAPWLAAQRGSDALGVVLYPEGTWDPSTNTLQSHFVMRRDVDAAWIGDSPVDLAGAEPFSLPVARDQAVVLRCGTAALGVRVPFARNVKGEDAPAALVFDGNAHGVIRLTVTHFDGSQTAADDTPPPGAALWVRVGSGLQDNDALAAWREAFAAAEARVTASGDTVHVDADGTDGPLVVAGTLPFTRKVELVPAPTEAILSIDGEDVGRAILHDLPVVTAFREKQAALVKVLVQPGGLAYLEAEDGLVMPDMTVAEAPDASGGRYVWTEGVSGARGGSDGSVTWRLDIARAADYYVWGRVLTPTDDDDSFFLALSGEDLDYGPAEWHTGRHDVWTWTPFREPGVKKPAAVAMPGGAVRLEIHGREDGAKLDRLMITDDPGLAPE